MPRLLVPIAAFLMMSQTQAIQLKFVNTKLACTRLFLQDLFPKIVEGRSQGAFVGTIFDLQTLNRKAGGKPQDVEIATGMFKKAFELPVPNMAVRRIENVLVALKARPDFLVVCALTPGCRLKFDKLGLHTYPLDSAYQTLPPRAPKPLEPLPADADISEDDPVNTYFSAIRETPGDRQFIFVDPPKSLEAQRGAIAWMTHVFGQLGEVANHEFVRIWITANRTLASMKQPTDRLFNQFVWNEDGEVVVHHGFYQIFSSGMLLLAYRGIFATLLSQSDSMSTLGSIEQSQQAWQKLAQMEWTRPLLLAFGVTEWNIPTVSEKLGIEMQQTIDRAQSALLDRGLPPLKGRFEK